MKKQLIIIEIILFILFAVSIFLVNRMDNIASIAVPILGLMLISLYIYSFVKQLKKVNLLFNYFELSIFISYIIISVLLVEKLPGADYMSYVFALMYIIYALINAFYYKNYTKALRGIIYFKVLCATYVSYFYL